MTTKDHNPTSAHALQAEAAQLLAGALAVEQRLHLAGVRDRYRRELEQVCELAMEVMSITDEPTVIESTRWTLLRACVARARDARYGAGQLSRGAQRAPTPADCDDGWERVAEIVATAEACSQQAGRLAAALNHPEALKAAAVAEVAAREARQIVDDRNHAYTFHTDPGFSFGEGWHVAAASVLTGAKVQIEPDKPQTEQAARFLHDAGLGDSIRPYRPRPRTNKQLTPIVAGAFRADPGAAQKALRTAFLGDAPPSPEILAWIRAAVGESRGAKVLLWVRRTTHNPERNTDPSELAALAERIRAARCTPLLFGDALEDGMVPPGSIDMTLAWREPLFQGAVMRRAQLQLFEELRRSSLLVGQIGVTSAGMDGPALLGLPTIYLTGAPNPRMSRWVGVVPGYREVVRRAGYLDAIEAILKEWESKVSLPEEEAPQP